MESRARRHEHLAQRRRGDAVDEPGERLETVLHGSLVALQAARRDIAVAQGFVHDFGAELAAVHRQERTAPLKWPNTAELLCTGLRLFMLKRLARKVSRPEASTTKRVSQHCAWPCSSTARTSEVEPRRNSTSVTLTPSRTCVPFAALFRSSKLSNSERRTS